MMTKEEITKENITQAFHDAEFLCKDLQEAFSTSENQVLNILLLEMIEKSADLRVRLKNLDSVMK